MLIENHFDVPLSPTQTWDILLDIKRIAPCVPGAQLTEVIDDRTYKGRVTIKLGPVALAFAGQVAFESLDAEARTAQLKAQGSDSKGRGGANAIVRFALIPHDQQTRVQVTTDLKLSGSVAQYGRAAGIIQQTAAQVLNQFSQNLAKQLAADSVAATSEDVILRPEAAAAKPLSLLALVAGLFRQAFTSLIQKRGSR